MQNERLKWVAFISLEGNAMSSAQAFPFLCKRFVSHQYFQ